MIRCIKLIIYLFFFSINFVNAHYFSESYSKWVINEDYVEGTFNILELESTRVLQLPEFQKYLYQDGLTESEVFLKYLEPRIRVSENDELCEKISVSFKNSTKQGALNILFKFKCDSVKSIKIINNGIFDIVQSHVHIARIYRGDSILREQALFYNNQVIDLSYENNTSQENNFFSSLLSFLVSGIHHILNGFDHLLFIAGLILLISGIKKLAFIITGFTIGHSITLGLSVLGVMTPNSILIESLIGYSILFVGIEYLLLKTRLYKEIIFFLIILFFSIATIDLIFNEFNHIFILLGLSLLTLGYFGLHKKISNSSLSLLIITLFFGLIHGFGFGSFLVKSEFSLNNIIPALLGFNIGVEIGQLIFVLIILLIFQSNKYLRINYINEYIKNIIFFFICSFGLFWFVQRLLI